MLTSPGDFLKGNPLYPFTKLDFQAGLLSGRLSGGFRASGLYSLPPTAPRPHNALSLVCFL